MADDTLELLRSRLPALFAQGLADLQRRAAEGDGSAHERLAALAHGKAAALLRLVGPGGGELHLASDGQALGIEAAKVAEAFGHALSLPAAAARHGLGMLGQGALEVQELVRAWAGLVSADARDLFAAATYAFELVITRVPVLGDLRMVVSLGNPSLPSTPEFVLSVDYDELEDAREQNQGPHQLFMAGKVQIDGDVAKAMMLGMTLAQLK